METISTYIEYIAKGVEILGIATIVIGIFIAFFKYFKPNNDTDGFKTLRCSLGRAILLGLEILVAADIIATVVTEPTMEKVLSLGLIVLIRTFLSFSIQMEIEGKLPWKKSKKITDS